MVPLIETSRLTLRSFRQDDLAAHAAMLGDPEVMRYLGGAPLPREESWRRMLTSTGLWALLGYGYWAVERREDGAYLGTAGFADFKRATEPRFEGEPEMGWIFAPHAHGRGYASEAVEAGLAWFERTLGPREVVSIIEPDNIPSVRVAEKAGFVRVRQGSYRDVPILLFRRPATSPAAATTATATAA